MATNFIEGGAGSSHFNLVQTELDTVYRQALAYNRFPDSLSIDSSDVFKVTTLDRAAYIGTITSGTTLFEKSGEISSYPTYKPVNFNKWTAYIQDFKKDLEISKNLFDDDQHQEVYRQIQEFAMAAKRTQTIYATNVFRSGFTTFLTADGAPFFGNHTTAQGEVVSNRLLVADLAGTGLTTTAFNSNTFNKAVTKLASIHGHNGQPMGRMADIVIVPLALWATARSFLRSVLLPDTNAFSTTANGNGVNVYSDGGVFNYRVYQSVDIGASHLSSFDGDSVGSDTAWFLLDSSYHTIRRFVRQELDAYLVDYKYSPTGDTYLYRAKYREEIFVVDYDGALGVSGDTV